MFAQRAKPGTSCGFAGAALGVVPVRHAVQSVTDEHDTEVTYEDEEAIEVVDGLPVETRGTRDLEPAEPAALPARQAAAVAVTGFAAGAVTAAVVRRRRARKPIRARKKKGVVGEIVSSNSFLVDVHLLKRD